jgi:alcohol dehydrogenase class IV
VREDQLDQIAATSLQNRWVRTNPRPITEAAQVRDILQAAW